MVCRARSTPSRLLEAVVLPVGLAMVVPAVLENQEVRQLNFKLAAEVGIRKMAMLPAAPLAEMAALELRHPFLAHLLPTAVEVVHTVGVTEREVAVVVAIKEPEERQTRAVAVGAMA